MKASKTIFGLAIILLFTIGMVISFSGCSKQLPFEPQISAEEETSDLSLSLGKKNKDRDKDKDEDYPQYAERTLKYTNDKKGYQGGNVNVPGGSTFHIKSGSLTPPPGTPHGASVTVTMLVEKIVNANDEEELIFTFGPSGVKFDPPAVAWMKWSDLEVKTVKLFYIDSGDNYIEQKPEKIDKKKKKLMIYIDHFSRYALCRGRH